MTQHELWIESVVGVLRSQKGMAERAIGQIDDAALNRRIAPGFNSIAIIMRHMAGNMLSRWTDFLTTDGEKPDRQREREFEDWTGTRRELLEIWDRGWERVIGTISSLSERDIEATVHVRGRPHRAAEAIAQQLSHYGYHVGQIVLLARLFAEPGKWQWLTIPPGESEAYNQRVRERSR